MSLHWESARPAVEPLLAPRSIYFRGSHSTRFHRSGRPVVGRNCTQGTAAPGIVVGPRPERASSRWLQCPQEQVRRQPQALVEPLKVSSCAVVELRGETVSRMTRNRPEGRRSPNLSKLPCAGVFHFSPESRKNAGSLYLPCIVVGASGRQPRRFECHGIRQAMMLP